MCLKILLSESYVSGKVLYLKVDQTGLWSLGCVFLWVEISVQRKESFHLNIILFLGCHWRRMYAYSNNWYITQKGNKVLFIGNLSTVTKSLWSLYWVKQQDKILSLSSKISSIVGSWGGSCKQCLVIKYMYLRREEKRR